MDEEEGGGKAAVGTQQRDQEETKTEKNADLNNGHSIQGSDEEESSIPLQDNNHEDTKSRTNDDDAKDDDGLQHAVSGTINQDEDDFGEEFSLHSPRSTKMSLYMLYTSSLLSAWSDR